jgi:hypothetical protein
MVFCNLFRPLRPAGDPTMSKLSRRALVAFVAVAALMPDIARAADALKEIHIDWAPTTRCR